MVQLYKIIEESEVSTTYQYNSLYSWLLLLVLAFMMLSVYLNNAVLESLCALLVVLYFSVKWLVGRVVTNKIKRAMKSASV